MSKEYVNTYGRMLKVHNLKVDGDQKKIKQVVVAMRFCIGVNFMDLINSRSCIELMKYIMFLGQNSHEPEKI